MTSQQPSSPVHSKQCLTASKSITRGTTRYSSSKPKGKLEQKLKLHSNCLHAKFSQYDNDSRHLEYLSVSGFTTASVFNLKTKLQYSKQHKSYLTCLCQNQLFKCKSKEKHDYNSQPFVSFHVSSNSFTTYTVQVVSNDSTCCKTSTIAVPHKIHDYLDASKNSKPAFPNRRYLPALSQSIVNQQSHFNTKFHRASSAMTFLVFSLSALQYLTATQFTMLQASVSRLPVSADIRQAPLFLHTTEPQVFNISYMWQLNQGH